MPTYDYECSACGHTYELFQSMTEKPVLVCPKCKKKKAKRLIGAGSGIIFKGTGFYETDYKRKEPSSGSRSGRSSGASSLPKESKPEKTDSVSAKESKADNSPASSGKEKKKE